MPFDTTLEGALRRDRWIVLTMLLAVLVASWAYILAGAGMGMSALDMTVMAGMTEMVMAPAAWSLGHALMIFAMWWVMMVAMMLPAATPMILLFAAVQRRQRKLGNPYVSTTLFTASYLVAWAAFSLAATAAHWGLHAGGLIGFDMALSSHLVGAVVLLAAGLYQLTPLKQACLTHCRFPVAWLAEHWRQGIAGALRMGFQHGAYCLGCCWVLMLLLFFGGVMNLYWIAGLAIYVLLEKTIPAGHWLGYGVGVALIGAGGWLLLAELMAM